METNYKMEVDSGYDRKKIIEANIISLLREGIPLDIIKQTPAFNFRYEEMLKNLEKGYKSKEDQILEMYGGYSKELTEQIVPDIYSGVSHPVGGELYPMTTEEEKEKFEERDNYIKEIKKRTSEEIKKLEEELTEVKINITQYKIKFPVIDRIMTTITELNNNKSNTEINTIKYAEIFKKNGLNPKDQEKYNAIYNGYKELINNLSELTEKYKDALNGKIHNQEIENIIDKKNILETEIIQRNTKLINCFIRKKYNDLLVETDDLFQICYIGIWEAVRKFDINLGYKFSTFAFKCMDIEIKSNFKNLTKYNWENYWQKKKIEILLRTTSEQLGRTIDIKYLIETGLLDVDEYRAENYMTEERPFSDLFPIKEDSYDELDRQYETYFGDDEIDDYEDDIAQIIVNYDAEMLKDELIKEMNNSFNNFTDREKTIITLRFGLNNNEIMSYDDLVKMFGVTRERIRQIESKIIKKLRHPSRSSNLAKYTDNNYYEKTIISRR